MKKILLILMATFMIAGCSESSIEANVASSNAQGTASIVTYINVGQGDSSLIQANGKTALIDAGHGKGYDDASVNYLKSKKITKIDYLILTHPDADHINDAADVINKFSVKKIFMSSMTSNTWTYKNIIATIRKKKIPVQTPKKGSQIYLGKAKITFIGVGQGARNTNDSSLIMNFNDGNHKFYFGGDASSTMEALLSKSELQCDVLKLSHHGSQYSSSNRTIKYSEAKYAVASCGKNNSYGHPNKQTLKRLSYFKVKLFRTDISGTIVCSSGKSLTFSAKATIPSVSSNTGSSYSNSSTSTGRVIANLNTKVFHKTSCRYVKKMSSKNMKSYKNRTSALKAGFTPCHFCNP